MSLVDINWQGALELEVIRRVRERLARRLDAKLGFAHASGVWAAGDEATRACAFEATQSVARGGQTVTLTCHPARRELATPVFYANQLLGCIIVSAPLGVEQTRISELMELCAEEIAFFAPSLLIAKVENGARQHNIYESLIGRSRPMREMFALIDKVADSESTVLIQGENGTGKELVARAIHFNSRRANQHFVQQNCSALNDNLLDSELFGHKRGSFTGAVTDKPGLFEVANGGTFFLDEVGDMSPTMQIKLLRVLQEGTYTPVGDTQPRTTNVRIIAASNRDLKRMMLKGEFRKDLYYRINVIVLSLPALRERRDDIPLLVDHFLNQLANKANAPQKKITRECMEYLLAYSWPGNVRELENEIERLVVLSGNELVIDETLLSPQIRAPQEINDHGLTSEAGSLANAIDTLERNLIHEALKRTNWNKTRAAEELNMSRRNLIRKVEKYRLNQQRPR